MQNKLLRAREPGQTLAVNLPANYPELPGKTRNFCRNNYLHEEIAMTLAPDSKGNYRTSRLSAIWMQAIVTNAARVRPRFKAGTLKNLSFWLIISCTLLMFASVIRMWSHWFEISALLGFYQAAGALTAVTGAAVIVFMLAEHWQRIGRRHRVRDCRV
jgi:hypothetical protein